MDEMIKKCVKEAYEIQMNGWVSCAESDIQLSDVFYVKMKKLIRRVRQVTKIKEIITYTASVVAVFLLVVILMHPQQVVKAFYTIMEWFENHVKFQISQQIGNGNCGRYTMQYVPKGYTLVEDSFYDNMGLSVYEKEGVPLYFTYNHTSNSTNMDNEGVTFEIYTLKDGTLLYCFLEAQENEGNSVTWLSKDQSVVFSIMGEIELEEMIKICENVEIIK